MKLNKSSIHSRPASLAFIVAMVALSNSLAVTLAQSPTVSDAKLTPWSEFRVHGATVYRAGTDQAILEVAERPEGDRLEMPALDNVVLRLDVPAQPTVGTLRLSQTSERWTVHVSPDVVFPARIRMQTAQPICYAPQPVVAQVSPDGCIVLDARHAVVHGEKLQFEPQTYKNTVGFWVNPSDWVEWYFDVAVEGTYRVRILQGCGQHQGGSQVALAIDDQQLEFTVLETGHFQNFRWRDLGEVRLSAGADQRLTLRVQQLAHQAVMDVRQLRLEPTNQIASADRLMTDVAVDLIVPPMTHGLPEAGRRVRQTTDGYPAAAVYHALYLPTNWQPNKQYPVLVELTGNGPYENKWGDHCSGQVEDAQFGFGISGGSEFLWLTLPYLNAAGDRNVATWWGDPPEYRVQKTLHYWQQTLDDICREYGGDPARLVLVGFSRGAIACNYLGLHDDAIARRWRAFVCFSHYDGVIDRWPYPGADRASAERRLQRLAGRPQFICSESVGTAASSLDATRAFVGKAAPLANVTWAQTGFRNHSDQWTLRPSDSRATLRRWLAEVTQLE